MSRTVLFSEVDEVADRFPDYVAEIREVFLHAHLPEAAEEILPAIADRIATDSVFREDLASMLTTVCALEPRISHLEVLGILVVAAVGAEQARVLAETPGVDLSARQIFNFVLESRRRRRDSTDEQVEEGVEEEPAAVADNPVPIAAAPESPVVQQVETAPVVPSPVVKPLVTATAPGDSSMLARALALAADDDVPASAEPPVRDPLPERAREVVQAPKPVMRSARFTHPAEPPRVVGTAEPPRVLRTPEPLVEELEQEETPPRRWGMWTAAACGVLLGFGLGVFAHFDHRSAPAGTQSETQSATSETEQAPAAENSGTTAPAPVKHMTLAEELRADLALLGHRSRPERPSAAHVSGREQPRPAAQASGRVREARRAASASGNTGPTLVVRSSDTVAAGAVTAGTRPGAGTTHVGSNAPAPLVASARPVNLGAAAEPGSSATRYANAGAPHVTTGSAGVMAANLLSSPAPAYPVAASAAGVQGEVIVEAVVGRDGGVVDTRIVSGPLLLRAAALDAVQRWHYRPYEVDGKPIEVATTARLEFRLDH